MITIMAEKPDMGLKIAKALGNLTESNSALEKKQKQDGFLKIDYKNQECYVVWAKGHLVELKQAKDYNPNYANWKNIPIPYIPDNYELQLKQLPTKSDKYNYNATVKKLFKNIKTYFNKSSFIINAADADREGEVIFYYIYDLIGCKKPVKRVLIDSTTPEGINKAFDNLINGGNRINIKDAGYMRGIFDWLIGSNLSVAMTLKYSSDRSVLSIGRVQTPTLAMVVKRTEEIYNFKSKKYYTIESVFTDKNNNNIQYKGNLKQEKIEDKQEADNIFNKIKNKDGVIKNIDSKTVFEDVPLLYNLASLQMDANQKYGFTLKKTLEIAQRLYDNGYTTYPRTDSAYLTEDMEGEINDILDKIKNIPEYNFLISGRQRVFDKKRFFDNSKVESHYAIIPTGQIPKSLSPDDQKIYDLICKSVIRMLYGKAEVKKTTVLTDVEGVEFVTKGSEIINKEWMVCGNSAKENILPSGLKEGMIVLSESELLEKDTQPPKKYTDKTLLAAMIAAGKNLDDKELREVLVNPKDPKSGGIGTPATRAAIIETLLNRDYIERDGKTIIATQKGIDLIHILPLEEIKSAELTAIGEKKLKEIERGLLNAGDFKEEMEEMVSDWCGKVDRAIQKTIVSNSGSSEHTCPICGKGLVKQKWGWGCSGYKTGCKFTISDKICGKKMTDSIVKKLLKDKETNQIKGFISKNKKKFNAKLIVDDSGKISFKFD